jgi:glyoxylase-like metal-dependent hydrolase (beta-lactamase superfamily II)
VLAGDLAAIDSEPWDYDDEFDIHDGIRLISTPGHTPGHQAMLISFGDGRRFACVGDAAYTLQAVVEHRNTGFPVDAAAATASLHTLTSLDAVLLTAHDIDQWSDVAEVSLIHAA